MMLPWILATLTALRRIPASRRGQGLVEYVLLLALIALVCISALSALGATLNTSWMSMLTGALSSTEAGLAS